MDFSNINLVVIGAGPGGYPAAFLAADLGLNVTLIDYEINPGGVCLYRGCIPTKTLLHGTKILNEAVHAKEFGILFDTPVVDLEKMRQNKRYVVEKLTAGLGVLARQRKINYIQGKASFKNNSVIRIEKTEGEIEDVSFDAAIIATGSHPTVYPSLHVDSPRLMYSASALELPDIPDTMLVIGGGYIGLEMGMIYSSLGTSVSVIELMPTLLPGADGDLVRTFQRSASTSFEKIITGAKVVGIKEGKECLSVKIETKKGELETHEYDKVLMTVGRSPNSEDLGLENTEVNCNDKGFIEINDRMETAASNIYAIGDVVGGAMLAHKATAEAKIAVQNIIGNPKVFNATAIPAVLFTDPEVTWCGLTENQAKSKKRIIKVARFMWGASGRAASLGRSDGVTKLIVDPETDVILGAGIVGPGAGELIAECTLAIEKGMTAAELSEIISPHPTLSETIMETAEAIHGVCTHLYQPKR